MSWKIYYTIKENIFRAAATKLKQEYGCSIIEDENLIIMGGQLLGLEKLRGSLDFDDEENSIFKVLGIITDLNVVGLLEPYLGAPTKLRVPKPSILEFASIIIGLRSLSPSDRMEFLKKNLKFSSVDYEHYVRELKKSATRPSADVQIKEAIKWI